MIRVHLRSGNSFFCIFFSFVPDQFCLLGSKRELYKQLSVPAHGNHSILMLLFLQNKTTTTIFNMKSKDLPKASRLLSRFISLLRLNYFIKIYTATAEYIELQI